MTVINNKKFKCLALDQNFCRIWNVALMNIIKSRHNKNIHLFISQCCSAISWAFIIIHEGLRLIHFEQNTICQWAHTLRRAPRPESPCPDPMDMCWFLSSAHGSRSRFFVTPHGLVIPAAHCVHTEGCAASAFCPAICKCCPCPLDLPELNLSTPWTRPWNPAAVQGKGGEKGGGEDTKMEEKGEKD